MINIPKLSSGKNLMKLLDRLRISRLVVVDFNQTGTASKELLLRSKVFKVGQDTSVHASPRQSELEVI